jgi:transcriptional regulator with XRE-family HTH domain
MDIGRAILEIRKEKGLKQEAVALDAGTDSGHLSRIETGGRKPSLPMLEKIAAAMGVRVTQIVATAEGKSVLDTAGQSISLCDADLSEDSIQLRYQFRELTTENQKIAVELLKALVRTQGNK